MSELWVKNQNIKRWCITNIRKASSNVLSEAPLSERNVSLTKSIFDLYFNTACAVHSVYCITSIISYYISQKLYWSVERAYLTEMLLFSSRIIFNLFFSTRRWGCVLKISLGRGPDKPYFKVKKLKIERYTQARPMFGQHPTVYKNVIGWFIRKQHVHPNDRRVN